MGEENEASTLATVRFYLTDLWLRFAWIVAARLPKAIAYSAFTRIYNDVYTEDERSQEDHTILDVSTRWINEF